MNGTAPVPAAVTVVQRPAGVPTLKSPHAELADSLAVAYVRWSLSSPEYHLTRM